MHNSTDIFPAIFREINELKEPSLSDARIQTLQPLIDFIQAKVEANQEIRLNFICTHNSRRSHLSQVWAQTLANYFKVPQVVCYSGGTEATALFPMAAETQERSGFVIEKLSDTKNPVYSIKFGANKHPVIGFSKTYEHSFNSQSNFAAIMTCSQADAGCLLYPVRKKGFRFRLKILKNLTAPRNRKKNTGNAVYRSPQNFFMYSLKSTLNNGRKKGNCVF